ncbi:MAG: hypothetical protein F7C34_02090 [Desulfurococcales archaeon]|nr:hypothetical protein [Desulfurococcales archaeon]
MHRLIRKQLEMAALIVFLSSIIFVVGAKRETTLLMVLGAVLMLAAPYIAVLLVTRLWARS